MPKPTYNGRMTHAPRDSESDSNSDLTDSAPCASDSFRNVTSKAAASKRDGVARSKVRHAITAAEAASPGLSNDAIPIGLAEESVGQADDTQERQPVDSGKSHAAGFDSESDEGKTVARRNFAVMALYQVIVRVGWIFKTESVIIPAVLDLIGGNALMRGCLPLLNRFGHSVPPLLLARRVKITKYKKTGLVLLTSGMGMCFLTLALMWWLTDGRAYAWFPFAFLLIYLLFFIFTGVNQLFFSTLQGKVIAPWSRGRQMWVANITGAFFAIGFAWWLLPGWLSSDGGRFELIFAFAGSCFVLSTIAVLFMVEREDNYQDAPLTIRQLASQTFMGLRQDRNLRRAAYAAVCFGSAMMLFPHYQALAREVLHLDMTNLMVWVVVQNSGTAIFSFVTGWIADRYGNRLALRCAMVLASGGPALSIALAMAGPSAKGWFAFVFLLVGMTPVTIKLFTNYALELAQPANHARYVSTLGLCFSAPILVFAPLTGWMIGEIGFSPVFSVILMILLVGIGLTFAIVEPRHKGFRPFGEEPFGEEPLGEKEV